MRTFADVNIAWLKKTLIATKVATPKDVETRAHAEDCELDIESWLEKSTEIRSLLKKDPAASFPAVRRESALPIGVTP